MSLSPDRLRLMVLTDVALAHPRDPVDVAASAIAGGATAIQLRLKGATTRDLLDAGRRLRIITRESGTLLIINDRVDIALEVLADGVHVGPADLPVAVVRERVPEDFIVGASIDEPERARHLVLEGADYIGCGAVFGTTTKDVGGEAIGVERLRQVVQAVTVPVVAIGGIHAANAAFLAGTGIAGAAVVSAVMAAPDPSRAAAGLLRAFEE